MPALQVLETDRLPEATRPAWDALALEQPLPSPFQQSWWLEARPAPRALWVLVLDGDDLVGGLALRRDRVLGVECLRMAQQGVLCPDHLDLLVRPGHEAAVLDALGRWLRRPGARVLDLAGVREDSHLTALLPATGVVGTAPWQPLPTDGRTYLATRSSSFRRSVRRSTTALAAAGLTWHAVDPADDTAREAVWADFARLHTGREGRADLLAVLPTLRGAVDAAAARGQARLDVLGEPGHAVAVLVSFAVGGRLSLYQLARSLDPAHAGAGTVLLHAVVDDVTAAGGTEVDLLRGSEAYKGRFADHERVLHAVRWGHGRRGRAVVGVLEARVAARRLAGRARRTVRARAVRARAGGQDPGAQPNGE